MKRSWPFFFIGVIVALVAEVLFGATWWQGSLVAGAVAAVLLLAEAAR